MPIKFLCPGCKATINAPDQLAGKTARCPGCKASVNVPAAAIQAATPPQSPTPPAASFEDLDDDADATATRPKSRAKLAALVIGIGSIVGLIALCGGGAIVWFMLSKPGGGGSGGPLAGLVGGNDKTLCLDYLKKNLDDPDDLEIVEWAEPVQLLLERPPTAKELEERQDWMKDIENARKGIKPPPPDKSRYNPATLMHLKYRAKAVLGGKTLRDYVFLIQNGKVVGAIDVRDHSYKNVYMKDGYVYSRTPVDSQLDWAIRCLGTFWDEDNKPWKAKK